MTNNRKGNTDNDVEDSLFIRFVPRTLKGQFKAACALRSVTMSQAIQSLMRTYIRESASPSKHQPATVIHGRDPSLKKAVMKKSKNQNMYHPLYAYLAKRQDQAMVRITFRAIADLLDTSLPASAFKYREWWANQSNTKNRPQAAAWQDAGFSVSAVQQGVDEGWVEFVRNRE